MVVSFTLSNNTRTRSHSAMIAKKTDAAWMSDVSFSVTCTSWNVPDMYL